MKLRLPPDLLCTCNDPLRIHERDGKGRCLYGYTCGCRRFKVSVRMVWRWIRRRVAKRVRGSFRGRS